MKLSKLKGADFFRKIPSDLTEATLAGASISVTAALVILFLLGAELSTYMSTETRTELVVDRSAHGELLRVNFNVSFPALSCEFATLDVSDAMGLKRLNLTKTVRKLPITADLQRVGGYAEDKSAHDPKYDEEHPGEQYDDVHLAEPLSEGSGSWDRTMQRYDIVVVNFFAPWCPWCQRLAPTWEAATEEVHSKYPEEDGRIRFAKVDCTVEVELCRRNVIQAFPTIRIFRHGSDDVTVNGGMHEHESYYGDRTKEALVALADGLVPTAGQPHGARAAVAGVATGAKADGCNFSGFLLVKKVPGTLHFVARAPGHSVDHLNQDLGHHVHHLYFGNRPSPRRRDALAALHPLGLSDDWADKMRGQSFETRHKGTTYEHYLQVVLTTVEPTTRPEASFDAYEYTVQSHTYDTEDSSTAKFTYRLSPIQIVVSEKTKPLYHFLISICAVIGGVFTVAGIIDGMVHQVGKISKKLELGKQG